MVIGVVGLKENPIALHHGVQDVEGDTHEHDGQRHLAFALQHPGEYDGSLEVVNLEDEQKHHGDDVKTVRRSQPDNDHGEEDGKFHQEPGQFVVDGLAPSVVQEHAVAGVDEVEGNEDDHTHGDHDPKIYVKS